MLVKKKKLPVSLLTDANSETKMNILDIEKYEVNDILIYLILKVSNKCTFQKGNIRPKS